MTLQFKGGLLLFDQGNLAMSENCCCPDEPGDECLVPSQWRLIDDDGNIHARGGVLVTNVLGIGAQTFLLDFPPTWTPKFYWKQGYSLRLEVLGCNDAEWSLLEEFGVQVALCGEEGERYPAHSFALPFDPPDNCACANMGAFLAGEEECDPCPKLQEDAGTGQMFRQPLPGPAYKFVGTIDDEWTNLLNWEDEQGNSPASQLPGENSDVVIAADVLRNSEYGLTPDVRTMLIEEGVTVGISFSTLSLVCYGTIDNAGCPCSEDPGEGCEHPCIYVQINFGGEGDGAIFRGTGKFGGESLAVMSVAPQSPVWFEDQSENHGHIYAYPSFYDESKNYGYTTGAEFKQTASNTSTGNVRGSAAFFDGAHNAGKVLSTAHFRGDSWNEGTIGIIDEHVCAPGSDEPGSGDTRFDDNSWNEGIVKGGGEFYDDAKNGQGGEASEATVEGDATFHQNAQNWGQVDGDATFSDQSVNIVGTVGGDATFDDSSQNIEGLVEGNAVFNDTAKNDGAVDGNADFYDSSWNGYEQGYVPPPGHAPVGGTATFYDTSRNILIISTAVFNGSSINTYRQTETTIESGGVTDATFNDNSENMRGAYTTNATFNGNSKNDGNVTQNATFNGASQNTADDPDNFMAVMGNATFNGDSVNRGDVQGTATFNACSWNDGGTAGTFNPDPPPSAYPC